MKKSRLIFFSLLILAAIFLSSCAGGTGVASSWPGMAVDTGHQTVYLAYGQAVYAINLENGLERWRFPDKADAKITFYAPPVLTQDGQLLVGSYDHLLYSLNPDNGQQNTTGWPFQGATNRYIAEPLVADGKVFAPNADQHLYALDLSGKELWKFKTGQSLWAMPAINGQTLYLPSMDHHLYALDAGGGNQIWRSEDLIGAMVGTPAVGPDGTLYLGTFAHEMLALNPNNGQVVWKTATDGWVWSGPALDDGSLYFGDLKGNFYALNAADGSVRWKITAQPGSVYAIAGQPLVTQDSVYFTTENGFLYAADKSNGNLRWNPKEIGGKLYTGPLAAGDKILIAAIEKDVLLVAVDKDGNQVWQPFTPAKK